MLEPDDGLVNVEEVTTSAVQRARPAPYKFTPKAKLKRPSKPTAPKPTAPKPERKRSPAPRRPTPVTSTDVSDAAKQKSFTLATRAVVRRARRDPGVVVTRSQLERSIAGRDKRLVDVDQVIAQAIADGWIIKADGGFRTPPTAGDEALARVLRDLTRPAWQADAACHEHPELPWTIERGSTARKQKAVCARCLVQDECLLEAMKSRDTVGIWGGTTYRERWRALDKITDQLVRRSQ